MMANGHGSLDWFENVRSIYFGYWRGTADFRSAVIRQLSGALPTSHCLLGGPRLSAPGRTNALQSLRILWVHDLNRNLECAGETLRGVFETSTFKRVLNQD